MDPDVLDLHLGQALDQVVAVNGEHSVIAASAPAVRPLPTSTNPISRYYPSAALLSFTVHAKSNQLFLRPFPARAGKNYGAGHDSGKGNLIKPC